jgi:hypothetical protein
MSMVLGLAGACSSGSGGSDGGAGTGGGGATAGTSGHGGVAGGGGTAGGGGGTAGAGGSGGAVDGGTDICISCSQAGDGLTCPAGVGTAGGAVHCANYGDICCGSDQRQYQCQDCLGANNCVWYPICTSTSVSTGAGGGS